MKYSYDNDTTPFITFKSLANQNINKCFQTNQEVSILLTQNNTECHMEDFYDVFDAKDWIISEIKKLKTLAKKENARENYRMKKYLLSNKSCNELKIQIFRESRMAIKSTSKICKFWDFRKSHIDFLIRKEKQNNSRQSNITSN